MYSGVLCVLLLLLVWCFFCLFVVSRSLKHLVMGYIEIIKRIRVVNKCQLNYHVEPQIYDPSCVRSADLR